MQLRREEDTPNFPLTHRATLVQRTSPANWQQTQRSGGQHATLPQQRAAEKVIGKQGHSTQKQHTAMQPTAPPRATRERVPTTLK